MRFYLMWRLMFDKLDVLLDGAYRFAVLLLGSSGSHRSKL